LAPAGVAGFFPGLVIGLDLFGEVGPCGVAYRGEDRRATAADRREGVGVLAAMRIGGSGFWYGFGTTATSLKL
jgi:hypothetical protein